jgi:general secretion pathway protein G
MGTGGSDTGRARCDDAGFTLVELMIVMVVLGILAGIVVFGVGAFRGDANAAACRANARTVATANAAYRIHHDGQDAPDTKTLVDEGYLRSEPAAVEDCDTQLASSTDSTTTSTTAGGGSTSSTSSTTTSSSTSTTSTTSSTTSSTSTTLVVKVALSGASGSAGRVGATDAWNATVNVSVVDGGGQPVSGALVAGAWSDAALGASCTTGASGTCSFSSSHTTSSPSTTRTWTVAAVTKVGAAPGTNAVSTVVCKRSNATNGTHACTVS